MLLFQNFCNGQIWPGRKQKVLNPHNSIQPKSVVQEITKGKKNFSINRKIFHIPGMYKTNTFLCWFGVTNSRHTRHRRVRERQRMGEGDSSRPARITLSLSPAGDPLILHNVTCTVFFLTFAHKNWLICSFCKSEERSLAGMTNMQIKSYFLSTNDLIKRSIFIKIKIHLQPPLMFVTTRS